MQTKMYKYYFANCSLFCWHKACFSKNGKYEQLTILIDVKVGPKTANIFYYLLTQQLRQWPWSLISQRDGQLLHFSLASKWPGMVTLLWFSTQSAIMFSFWTKRGSTPFHPYNRASCSVSAFSYWKTRRIRNDFDKIVIVKNTEIYINSLFLI